MYSSNAARAAQASSSSVVWLPLLTFGLPSGNAIGTAVPDFPAGVNYASPGTILQANQSLVSNNRWYRAIMQGDGNFVVYDKSGKVRWSSGTYGNPGAFFAFQTDGNLCVYAQDGRNLFSAGVTGAVGLWLQDDGNLVARDASNNAVWHIGAAVPFGTRVIEPTESTLRVVNNTENVVSRGQLFYATAFDLILPQEDGESFPSVSLKIANVDGMMIQAIRGFSEPPSLTIDIVLSDNTDYVERKVDFLVLRSVEFNALTISGKLMVESSLQNRFPVEDYTPRFYPGLFI